MLTSELYYKAHLDIDNLVSSHLSDGLENKEVFLIKNISVIVV